jgi:deferrochelatase/peroxidase EfeB
MGFKDGTNNIRAEDTEALRKHVWLPDGGTFMVTRRIRMLIETWDRAPLKDQEDTIGRTKAAGALIADRVPSSHVALAHNRRTKLLRRGYSFTDGMDARLGQLDAGLFFIAFQRDPQQFVTLQRKLGADDALNEYIKHVGSAVFYVPPGVRPGGVVGQGLLV